jgi:hypothetical protein
LTSNCYPVINESMSDNSEEKIYEMLWDCKYCGTKKLLGLTHRFCPNCGAAQEANARYYPEKEEDYVAVQDHEYVGADKKCSSCGTPLSAKTTFCTQCGAGMEGEKSVNIQADQVVGADGKIIADANVAGAPGSASVSGSGNSAGTPPGGGIPASDLSGSGETPPKKNWKWPVIGGVIGITAIALLVGLFWKKEVSADLTGHQWERIINIDKYGPVSHSAWCDSMPFGAYGVSRSREVRSTKQVPDGEECSTRKTDRGDGTFKSKKECHTKYRSENVYDEKCHFLVNEWSHSRTEKSGEKRKSAQRFWPPDRISRTGQCLGCEREANRKETLNLLFHSSENKDFVCDVKEDVWMGAEMGSAWSIKVSVLGSVPSCGTLKHK